MPCCMRRCPTRRRARTSPALGTIKVESDTSVALDERLVSFSEFKITESNFPTLQRDQLRTVVQEIAASVPLDERVIALDRVLANVDTSQIIPKNVEGVKADPPPIFFSKTPAVLVNIDGEPIWAPIPQNDLRSAVNTNWDLFEHGPTKTYYLRHDKVWMKATDVKGPWDAGRHVAGELQEAARRRELERREVEPPGHEGQRQPGAEGVRQPATRRTDPAARRAELSGGPGREAAPVGQQHRQRRLPDGPHRRRLLPRVGPLVLGAGLHGALDVRDADPARPTSSRSRSSTSGPASSRRCRARRRPPRPSCSRRFRRRRA